MILNYLTFRCCNSPRKEITMHNSWLVSREGYQNNLHVLSYGAAIRAFHTVTPSVECVWWMGAWQQFGPELGYLSHTMLLYCTIVHPGLMTLTLDIFWSIANHDLPLPSSNAVSCCSVRLLEIHCLLFISNRVMLFMFRLSVITAYIQSCRICK